MQDFDHALRDIKALPKPFRGDLLANLSMYNIYRPPENHQMSAFRDVLEEIAAYPYATAASHFAHMWHRLVAYQRLISWRRLDSASMNARNCPRLTGQGRWKISRTRSEGTTCRKPTEYRQ